MDILILIGLIALNGLFAMTELALVTARRARLVRLAETGDKAAGRAVTLQDAPTAFMSTIQIGITSISILNGIVGEAVLAGPLAARLQAVGVAPEASLVVATVVVVVGITYVSIVVGELLPKRLAQANPEAIARLAAGPMHVLALVARPFVWLLSASTDALLRLFTPRLQSGPSVTAEEIHALLEEGSQAGVIEHEERQLVRNVFRLDERMVGTLMVPRGDVVHLDVTRPWAENLQRAIDSEHALFPVCRGGLHAVLGVVSAKQMLAQALSGAPGDLASLIQPPRYVPETLSGLDLLAQFRASGTPMALVIDEYGDFEGLVTVQDVLEAVTGEFAGLDREAWAVQREDGSWLLDGMIPIPELKDTLHLQAVPDEEEGRYHTLSGMMMALLGRMPQTGDVATWAAWRLEVVDMDGRRVDKVLASREADR